MLLKSPPLRSCSSLLASVACLTLMLPAAAPAQQNGGFSSTGGKSGKLYESSHALIIGVSDYTAGWSALPEVSRIVPKVAAALRQQGFEVELALNVTGQAFDQALKGFIGKYGQTAGNRLLIYFAGHATTLRTSDGRALGYVVPADAPVVAKNVGLFKQSAVSTGQIEAYLQQAEARHVLFVIDDCLGGAPFVAHASDSATNSRQAALPVRQFIVAGAELEVADHSLFGQQFIAGLTGLADANKDGWVTGNELGAYLATNVAAASSRAQTPYWGVTNDPNLKDGDFVFIVPGPTEPAAAAPVVAAVAPRSTPTPDPAAAELSYWDTIRNSSDPNVFKDYLARYPDGRYAAIARLKSQPAPPPVASPPVAPPPSSGAVGATDEYKAPAATPARDNSEARASEARNRPSGSHTRSAVLLARGVEKFNAAFKAKDEAGREAARADFKAAIEAAEIALSLKRTGRTGSNSDISASYSMGGAFFNNQDPELVYLYDRAEAYRVALQTGTQVEAETAVRAIQEYVAAEVDGEKKGKARVALGQALFNCGRIDEAIATYRAILSASRENWDALFGLGLALAADPKGGATVEARDTLQRFLDKAPANHPRRRDATDAVQALNTALKAARR